MNETYVKATNELIMRVVTRDRGNFSVGYKQLSWKMVDLVENCDYDEDGVIINDAFRLNHP